MTHSKLIRPTRARLLPQDRRQFLLTGAAATSAGFFTPEMLLANSRTRCNWINNLLKEARAQAEDPTRWTKENGAFAAERLQAQLAAARQRLEAAQKKEEDLDTALLVDVVALTGGAVLFATGIATAGTLTATGAGVLFLTNVLFNSTMLAAQIETNGTKPEPVELIYADGTIPGFFDDLGGMIDDAAVTVTSQNIGKYMSAAGKLLGASALAFAAKETWDTYQDDAKVEGEIEALLQRIAELEPELERLQTENAMNELREASARSLVDDLEPYAEEECGPPRRIKRKGLTRN